jgi:hypothetical protein
MDDRDSSAASQVFGESFAYIFMGYTEGWDPDDAEFERIHSLLAGTTPPRLHQQIFDASLRLDISDRLFAQARDDPITELLRLMPLILRSSWWSRLWVVQEVALSSSTTILPGSFDYSCLVNACTFLVHVRSRSQASNDLEGWNNFFDSASVSLIIPEVARTWLSTWQRRPLSTQLSHMLQMVRGKKASIPHDYIYGVLGMLHNAPTSATLPVDYSIPFEQVWLTYTLLVLKETDNLNIITTSFEEPLEDCP